jgi:5'-methylthioadenosine phosphorylase
MLVSRHARLYRAERPENLTRLAAKLKPNFAPHCLPLESDAQESLRNGAGRDKVRNTTAGITATLIIRNKERLAMRIGVIGGTGLYDPGFFEENERLELETPFGAPSDAYVRGVLDGIEVFFLARHGHGHHILPSEINHRANIYGFKKLGVERILSVSAVGSLRQEYRPRDVLLPDQYFDRTKASERHTFFGLGLVAHIAFGDPVCPDLRQTVFDAAVGLTAGGKYGGVRIHNGGVYVNIEGPAFSTKAESHFYRRCDFDVIGMTSLAEAKLAREAEICFVSISMITDYDCWHETAAPVTVEMVLGHLQANTELARAIVHAVIPLAARGRRCACGEALKNAILTDRRHVPKKVLKDLEPIVGRYFTP